MPQLVDFKDRFLGSTTTLTTTKTTTTTIATSYNINNNLMGCDTIELNLVFIAKVFETNDRSLQALVHDSGRIQLVNPLSPRRGPKDPQLSKSLNALNKVFNGGQNVFDFWNNDLKKVLIPKL